MELPASIQELLLRVPRRHREDAQQEAWLGWLQAERDGLDPTEGAREAILAYGRQERKHERRRVDLTSKLINRVSAQNRHI